jgi:hypothetical protein
VKTKALAEQRQTQQQLHGHKGYDPLLAVWRESKSFNASWLKNGESLSLLQRTGFTIFSLFFVAAGLYMLNVFWMFLKDLDFMSIIFGPASLFFLCGGIFGLRNVLRFEQGKPKE